MTPIVVLALLADQLWPIHSILCIASVLCLVEFYRITSPGLGHIFHFTSYCITVFLFVVLFFGEIHLLPLLVICWAFFPLLFMVLFQPEPENKKIEGLAKLLLGPIYICLPLALLAIISRYPAGKAWIMFLLVVVFAGDTGAFYMGRLLGSRKLHPKVSPSKSWEGALGGMISSLIFGAWFIHLFGLARLNIWSFLWILSISVVAQLGDLSESFVKRAYGVKDSGSILPGHGGILDRIDGVLFSAPLLYIFLLLKIMNH